MASISIDVAIEIDVLMVICIGFVVIRAVGRLPTNTQSIIAFLVVREQRSSGQVK